VALPFSVVSKNRKEEIEKRIRATTRPLRQSKSDGGQEIKVNKYKYFSIF
jgi:hypothetical protein